MAGEVAASELVARFGSFLLCSRESFASDETMFEIADVLATEPAVAWVDCPLGYEGNLCYVRRIYPARGDTDGPLSEQELLHGVDFVAYLEFEVSERSPKGEERNYHVLWNGWLAVVSWERERGVGFEPEDAMIVRELLERAASSVGLSIRTQACTAECHHGFAHTNVVFASSEEDSCELEYISAQLEIEARARETDGRELALLLYGDLKLLMNVYTEMKNVGERILDYERDGRDTLAKLAQLGFERASARSGGIRTRFGGLGSRRGSRRHARLLIAKVWMMMAQTEALRRRWRALRASFESSPDERGQRQLLCRDYGVDLARIESLDLGLLRASAEEMAARLDSNALLWATAFGGGAGAIAGGLIALLSAPS